MRERSDKYLECRDCHWFAGAYEDLKDDDPSVGMMTGGWFCQSCDIFISDLDMEGDD